MGIMSFLRFELTKFVDFCLGTVSSQTRAVFKDTRQRPRIFVYVNFIVCAVNVIFFSIEHPLGIKRSREKTYRFIFIAVSSFGWIMAVGLIYALKRKNYILCRVWCLLETAIILSYLLLLLTEHVRLYWSGLSLLIVSTMIKMHGLWVMFYFSLEIKYSPGIHTRQVQEPAEDGYNIKYFIPRNRRTMERRQTDQTSVASSPPSPTEANDVDQDSVLDDKSPTRNSFEFFGEVEHNLQYSELMVPTQDTSGIESSADLLYSSPSLLSTSKDNIIISELMCGGSSSVNIEPER